MHRNRPGRSATERRARHSSTACHSGEAYASGRNTAVSCSTGKNTPANNVEGITTNRNSSEK
ncbi:hypothetical protein [Microbispora sp. GKU 823]|uniref:hypothetical protein n=1 Tax=Microbispora sp. GKU 823 TaxID=1652100 RepID=UPI0021191BF0|nr:hypothetical protein [Microbispora sp. GKU 823]